MFWFWVIVIIVILVFISNAQASRNNEKRINNINNNTNWMVKNNFKCTSEIKYYDSVYSNGFTIDVDNINKKLLISDVLSGSRRVINFNEVIGMEVLEDDISTNGIGRAAIGGILFGGAGAIVGANTAKKTLKTVKLILYLNNVDNPKYEMIFSHSNKIKSDSTTYKSIMSFISQVDATIRSIIVQNENGKIDSNEKAEISSESNREEINNINLENEYKAYILQGQKVLAIKKYREKVGCTLKEATDYINEIEKQL